MTKLSPLTSQQDRQRLIRVIHVGKRELGLEDDTYRSMLSCLVKGKTSTTAMSVPELERVLGGMKARGFKVKGSSGTRPKADDRQSSKILALWLELHRLGYVTNASDAALAAWVQRMTKVSALQWLSGRQASDVIEGLKKWLERDQKKIYALRSSLAARGLFDFTEADDALCLRVTGSAELTKASAETLIAYLEGLGHVA